jgi:hypothetical protein
MTMEEFDDLFEESSVVGGENNEPVSGENLSNDDFLLEGEDPITKEPTLVDELLKLRGISNAKIKILDEKDQEQEVDFYGLTKEEQLEILNARNEDNVTNPNLDEEEILLLNHLRSNNLTVEAFLQQFKDSIASELGKPAEATYDIDAYDDQELYLLDMKNKFELTDDELVAELEKELKNPEIFNKKVTKLRGEYKTLEDQYKLTQSQEAEQLREQEYNQFADQMVDIATKINEFHGIDLEDEDKNETLSYLLELDDKGLSNFYKDLNNPTKLYEAAWYLRYGKEAFDAIKNAYEAEITRLKKPVKPNVVVQNASKRKENIHDLF